MDLKFKRETIEIEKFLLMLEPIKAEVIGVTLLFQKEIILVVIKLVGILPLENSFLII